MSLNVVQEIWDSLILPHITDDFYFFYCCIKDSFFLFQLQ